MNLRIVQYDLLLKALVAVTVKTSLRSLSSSDTNSFWDAFNDEIIAMASVIPTCFSSTIWVKVFSWVSNFNFMHVTAKKRKHLLKFMTKILFTQLKNFSVIFLLKAITNIVDNYFNCVIKEMVVLFLNFRYKFCRSFFFLIMTQNFSFSR